MAYPLPRESEKLPLVTKPMTALSDGTTFDSWEVKVYMCPREIGDAKESLD